MSQPVTTPQPTFEFPERDCPSLQNLQSSESVNFSAGSNNAAGFNYSKTGPEKSNISSRSRPRLTKVRRKQMVASQDGKSVKTDLGLDGFSGFSGEVKFDVNLGNLFGDNDNLGPNGSVGGGDSNGNVEQVGNGLGFGGSSNGSLFGLGLGSGKSLFGSCINNSSSNLHWKEDGSLFASNKANSNVDVQKETGSFVFGTCKVGGSTNVNFPGGGSGLGPSKSGLPMDTNPESVQFVFGADETESGSKSNFSEQVPRGNLRRSKVHEFHKSVSNGFVFGSQKLDQQDSNKPVLHFGVGEFRKVNSAKFVFSATMNASSVLKSDPQKQDCVKNMDKSEFDRDAGNTVPDMRSKVNLDASGDSEKVCHPCSHFPFNWSDSSSKNHVNFVFGSNNSDSKLGIDLEKKSTATYMGMSNFTDRSNENAEFGIQFQNTCQNEFVFGGLKGNGSFNSDGSTMLFNGTNQLNSGKTEDCNGSRQHNHNAPSNIDSKFQNNSSSGGSSEKGPTFRISNEMKRSNIGDFEVDSNKTKIFTSNFSVINNNTSVFGHDQKFSDFSKENHSTNMSKTIPDMSHMPVNNSESNRTSASLFPSVGIGIQLNGGFCQVQSMNEDEKDSISLASKVAGLHLSDADYSTPNMKFVFSNCNLFPCVDKKLDNANSKSLGGKRSKRRNGKLRQKTMVHQLFGQDHVSKEGSSQLNQKSPGCGSPMDFSPYQDTSASNLSEADIGTGVKVKFAVNKKDISELCEKPHDEESKSNFSPSLPAQDGLSAVRRRYRIKYRLKRGSQNTVQGSNSDKENAGQESVGTATHEVCENWRIRGNQAYHARKLSVAEEFYSMGINSVQHVNILGNSMKPLLLCYSNRAATRMSLGRMREAIGDCEKATELDPNFLKVTLRAGNCYLVLGEVEDSIQCYTKCLSSGTDLCLDRRITIEAADGVQKAKRVAEYMHQSAKLLLEGTDSAASSALQNIAEALSISCYSEKLLKMKGEALSILRMDDEVIQLCEQTLDIARKNFGADHLDAPSCKQFYVKLWRWHLLAKSHYRRGRLELALDLIEKLEKNSISFESGDVGQESIALSATIRELLCLKKSGNEAFNSGKYTEAVENYTTAISKSFESRPFMAICFCNRAAAYQSLNQIVDAIADCSVAIALNENYEKAISRRATLHEMVRDYKQTVHDLQRLVSLLETQSQTKSQQNVSQGRSSGGSVKDLRRARRRLSTVEEKAKKEISLDFYLILGIKASDVESEIKRAYRKAALRHHPDKAGQVLARSDVGDDGKLLKEFGEKIHKDADRLFKTIGEAYAVLSDPLKRSKYDSEEEMRSIYRDSNRNSNSGHPSTSYSSPYERSSWSGRQAGPSTSSERNNSKRYWNDSRSYGSSRWRWEDF